MTMQYDFWQQLIVSLIVIGSSVYVFWSVAATIPGYALLGGLAVLGVVAGLRRRRRA